MLSSQVPRGGLDFARDSSKGHNRHAHILGLLFQAPAGGEAGLNPNPSIQDAAPEGAICRRSEGLLQLAYADHKRYGCDFNWQLDRALKANDPKTILQPKNNLECGEDSGEPDNRASQTPADPVGILVNVAPRRSQLPCIRQANEKSSGCVWSVHLADRQVSYYQVCA